MTNKTDYTDDEWTSVKAQKGMTISLVTVKELLESVPDLAEPGALIPPDLPTAEGARRFRPPVTA